MLISLQSYYKFLIHANFLPFLHFFPIIFCQAYCLAQFLLQNYKQYVRSVYKIEGMKKFLILGISFLQVVFVPLFAQHTLSGTLLSKTDGAPIEMATVRLFSYHHLSGVNPETGKPLLDSTLVQGAQTTYDGIFILNNIPEGQYKLILSSVGFAELVKPIDMPNHHLDLPAIRLTEQVQHLAEVSVQGKAAEMIVKGDTIEYNTAAYQVSETANVEELLKKMNGVEVDKEGKVTINGEEIKAVRIDGKKFFGNDVQTATKNIPADMIDKIQVIDEKSDMAKLTGFEDDDTERIINLSLKKNRKQGLFGNYSGALGADLVADNGRWFDYDNQFFSNDFRYGANVFTNLLLGESQTTIVGSANNTNEIRSGRGWQLGRTKRWYYCFWKLGCKYQYWSYQQDPEKRQ